MQRTAQHAALSTTCSAQHNMQRSAQHCTFQLWLHLASAATAEACPGQPELAQQATDWHSFSCCLDTPTGATYPEPHIHAAGATTTTTSHTPAAHHATGPLAAAATVPLAAAAAAAPIIIPHMREGHQPVTMPGPGPATTPTPTERYSEVGTVTLLAYFTMP